MQTGKIHWPASQSPVSHANRDTVDLQNGQIPECLGPAHVDLPLVEDNLSANMTTTMHEHYPRE